MATMFVTDEMIKRAKELADELFYDFECILFLSSFCQ